MKKRFYLLGMLAAGLTFAGCTDDIDDATGSGVASGDKGYVKIAINLPTTSGQVTRSENDVFDDGLADEYAVNDAYLLLFGGPSEGQAQLGSWYKINTSFSGVGTTTDNITTQSEVVQQIVKPTGDNTYALVVLNNNNNLAFEEMAIEGINNAGTTVTIGGTSVSTLASLQSALAKEVTAFIGASGNSFTMTNAPIASIPGVAAPLEGQSVTTLVELEVFDNEDHANAAAPDEIYVERAVAKVTVNGVQGLFDNQYIANIEASNNSQYSGDKVRLDGWYLNVTNKSTKFVRDVEDWADWASYSNSTQNTANRFFGQRENPYRVYWAIDGNYNLDWETESLKNHFNVYDETNAPYITGDMFSTPAYCLENTMNYNHMMQKETTGIVFKMTYLMDGEESPGTFYIIGDPKTSDSLYGVDFVAAINEKLEDSGFEVQLVANPAGGYYSTAADMKKLFVIKETGVDLKDEQAHDIVTALNNEVIRVYEDGMAYYYAARIQHFGDFYCKIPNGYVDDVSEYGEEHLGRYGVVRNNWYEILINSISGPGRPTPPDPTDPTDPDNPDPDDPKDDAFINCRINILSWAKRSQKVDL